MAHHFFHTLKTQYPHPIPATRPEMQRDPGCYCIGGALLAFAGHLDMTTLPWEERFPGEGMIAETLERLNQRLDDIQADRIATELITYNDMGAFRAAWYLLEQALVWQGDNLLAVLMTAEEIAREEGKEFEDLAL
jgi:hypothetical protein